MVLNVISIIFLAAIFTAIGVAIWEECSPYWKAWFKKKFSRRD